MTDMIGELHFWRTNRDCEEAAEKKVAPKSRSNVSVNQESYRCQSLVCEDPRQCQWEGENLEERENFGTTRQEHNTKFLIKDFE